MGRGARGDVIKLHALALRQRLTKLVDGGRSRRLQGQIDSPVPGQGIKASQRTDDERRVGDTVGKIGAKKRRKRRQADEESLRFGLGEAKRRRRSHR